MLYLQDKVAVVTGGAKGMGEAICRKFAEEGAAVIVNDIDLPGAQKVSDEIIAKGGRAVANRVDQTKQEAVNLAVEQAVSQFGKIDILINNAGGVAGMNGRGPSDTIVMEEWDRIVDINLKGRAFPGIRSVGFRDGPADLRRRRLPQRLSLHRAASRGTAELMINNPNRG